jgi:hypothetical protein
MSKKFERVSPKNEGENNALLEQYKMLVESIDKINDTREFSNSFWIGANGVGLSALAYLRDAQNIYQHHKSFLLMTLIAMGVLFCLSWLSYLATIKKSVEIRGQLLVHLEKNLPLQIFSKIFALSETKSDTGSLTAKEMFVPGLFLLGYIFSAILLIFFPQEVMSNIKAN